MHYSEICKSELRRSDRRAAMCVEKIFFKTKKLQMKILLGKSQIALIHLDKGVKFLRALRDHPPTLRKQREICLQ